MGCVYDYDPFSGGDLRVVETRRSLSLVSGTARFSPAPSTKSDPAERERFTISL